jgi:MFS family permease
MPQKIKQRRLLWLQLFFYLGVGMTGLFLPFFIAKNFGLEIDQMILVMAFIWTLPGVVAYPLNFLLGKWVSNRRLMMMGIFLGICFYSGLIFFGQSLAALITLIFIYAFHLMLFWPAWHQAVLESTEEAGRGNFLGNFQIITVSASLVTPILIGIFIDLDFENWILGAGILFYALALFQAARVHVPESKAENLALFCADLRRVKGTYIRGILVMGMHHVVLSILWIIALKLTLGNFTGIGILATLAAGVEIISAKFWGKHIDKKSAKKVIQMGVWARFFDISVRSVLIAFPSVWLAGILQVWGGLLGPIFNNSSQSRFYEQAHSYTKNTANFFIITEVLLGVSRGLTLFLAYVVWQFLGEGMIVVFLLLAGLLSFVFRRF